MCDSCKNIINNYMDLHNRWMIVVKQMKNWKPEHAVKDIEALHKEGQDKYYT